MSNYFANMSILKYLNWITKAGNSIQFLMCRLYIILKIFKIHNYFIYIMYLHFKVKIWGKIKNTIFHLTILFKIFEFKNKFKLITYIHVINLTTSSLFFFSFNYPIFLIFFILTITNINVNSHLIKCFAFLTAKIFSDIN